LSAGLAALAKDGALSWVARDYEAGDLSGAWLAVAATDDPATNMAVAEEAAQRRILANVVDRPAACSFIARKVREEVERLVPPEYGELLKVAAEVRDALRAQGLRAPPDLWQRALSPHIAELASQQRRQEAIEALTKALTQGLGPSR
jgi:siroheme synthase (precorrin-2 oxidase/ferrochelatase)